MEIPHGGVAFFDSGIGGLTVFAECRKRIPWGDFYYLGDNARAPYGNLEEERIFSYVEEAFALFVSLEVRAVVIACNTATAVCIERLRKKYPFPIIGAEPAVLPAAKLGGEVLILSTNATGKSQRFKLLCERAKNVYNEVVLHSVPTPDLAGVIEKNILNSSFSYEAYLPQEKPTSVVLGCTHYVYIKQRIEKHYSCPVFDGNLGIANRLFNVLSTTEKPSFFSNCRDEQPLVTTAQPPKNWFLGSEKLRNMSIFKQMFVK